MPRRLLLAAVFVAALLPWVATPQPVLAQEDDTKKIKFKTADEVTLHATLYKSKAKNPNNSPCVILLHQPLTDPNKGDLGGLAKTLAKEGYNVLRLDFRGHGDSTLVNPAKFWSDPINATFFPKEAKKKPLPNKFELPKDATKATKDMKNYLPKLAEDIMAARVALDQLSDNNEVNSSSVYLVGPQDCATLGTLYATTEWVRPQKIPASLIGNHPALAAKNGGGPAVGGEPAGKDLGGAVWLSPTVPANGIVDVDNKTVQRWMAFAPELRDRTPVLCIYGDKDTAGQSGATFFQDKVFVANPPKGSPLSKLGMNKTMTVKSTLTGVGLLGQQLGTEKLIVDYLEALEKERLNLIRIPNRGFPTPPPIDLKSFGVCDK